MSLHLVVEVWEKSKQSGTELVVLMVLADEAVENAGEISTEELARKARCSQKRCMKAVDRLAKAGEVMVVRYAKGGFDYWFPHHV